MASNQKSGTQILLGIIGTALLLGFFSYMREMSRPKIYTGPPDPHNYWSIYSGDLRNLIHLLSDVCSDPTDTSQNFMNRYANFKKDQKYLTDVENKFLEGGAQTFILFSILGSKDAFVATNKWYETGTYDVILSDDSDSLLNVLSTKYSVPDISDTLRSQFKTLAAQIVSENSSKKFSGEQLIALKAAYKKSMTKYIILAVNRMANVYNDLLKDSLPPMYIIKAKTILKE